MTIAGLWRNKKRLAYELVDWSVAMGFVDLESCRILGLERCCNTSSPHALAVASMNKKSVGGSGKYVAYVFVDDQSWNLGLLRAPDLLIFEILGFRRL